MKPTISCAEDVVTARNGFASPKHPQPGARVFPALSSVPAHIHATAALGRAGHVTEPPWRLFARRASGYPARGDAGRRIRVVICHEADAVRGAVERVLDNADDIEVVGTAAEADEGVKASRRLRPDIVLTDLCMPHVDGIATARRIGAHAPGSHVLLFTAAAYPQHLRDAAAAGAVGFVLKDSTPGDLLSAIRAAAGHG